MKTSNTSIIKLNQIQAQPKLNSTQTTDLGTTQLILLLVLFVCSIPEGILCLFGCGGNGRWLLSLTVGWVAGLLENLPISFSISVGVEAELSQIEAISLQCFLATCSRTNYFPFFISIQLRIKKTLYHKVSNLSLLHGTSMLRTSRLAFGSAQKPRGRHMSRPRQPFWSPLAAILDF